jgi:hypothetical protein
LRSTQSRRRGTVSIEYVIVLGASIVCAGLATGTAIRTMEFQSVADVTAAAMAADFTQAAAEATADANVATFNQTALAVYGPVNYPTPLVATGPSNGTVESAATTIGPLTDQPLTGIAAFP